MHYQHLKTIKKTKSKILPILPIFAVFLFFFTKPSIPTFISNLTDSVSIPAWNARNSLMTNVFNSFDFLKNKEELLKENSYLKEVVEKMKRENFASKALKTENERLLKLLGRMEQETTLVPATVINNIAHSPYDTFVLDVGKDNNISNGMLVETPEGITVGVISNVKEKTSTVTLFSAPTMSFNAIINSTTTQHEKVTGYGLGTMRMSVPRDTKVKIGDAIILQSFLTHSVGNVISVEVSPEDAYKTLYIKAPVNIYNLRFVMVDTSSVWEDVVKNDE